MSILTVKSAGDNYLKALSAVSNRGRRACTAVLSGQDLILLDAQLHIFVLISLEVTMDSSIFKAGQVHYTDLT